jgi:Flp pilus assembly protein TadD
MWKPMRLSDARAARFLRSAALAAVLALVAGCNTTSGPETTGSLGMASAPKSEAEWRRTADNLSERYRANPKDPQVAILYAQALRATAQRSQAVAVLEQASIANPHDRAVLGAYGRALADVGRYDQALGVLEKAHTPDQPDWRILNVQGAVLDQLGRHDEARRHYSSALKIRPDDPSVLSNLGLSYALVSDLKRAEEILRKASVQPNASPKVRQNLALVIGLQGRFAEAETIVRADLPPAEAEANVGYLRDMLAEHNSWAKPAAAGASKTKKRVRRSLPQPDTDAGT